MLSWLEYCPDTPRSWVRSLVRAHTSSNQWVHEWVEQQINVCLSVSLSLSLCLSICLSPSLHLPPSLSLKSIFLKEVHYSITFFSIYCQQEWEMCSTLRMCKNAETLALKEAGISCLKCHRKEHHISSTALSKYSFVSMFVYTVLKA